MNWYLLNRFCIIYLLWNLVFILPFWLVKKVVYPVLTKFHCLYVFNNILAIVLKGYLVFINWKPCNCSHSHRGIRPHFLSASESYCCFFLTVWTNEGLFFSCFDLYIWSLYQSIIWKMYDRWNHGHLAVSKWLQKGKLRQYLCRLKTNTVVVYTLSRMERLARKLILKHLLLQTRLVLRYCAKISIWHISTTTHHNLFL